MLIAIVLILACGSLQREDSKELSDNDDSYDTEMYCQVEFIIKEKWLNIENITNNFSAFLGNAIQDIDCDAVLKNYEEKYSRKFLDFVGKKGVLFLNLSNCILEKMKELGYFKMRFRFYALGGIEIENSKRVLLRNQIDEQIDEVTVKSFDACQIIAAQNNETYGQIPGET